ncbi:MAG: DRTGG domain-containing protein [bacterium]
MKVKDIVESLSLSVITGREQLDREITGGYCSDLLSDVLANAKRGDIWITLQVHQNIIAVASMKELSGVILVNNRKPDPDTLQKAEDEDIPILSCPFSSFELAGRLYQLGIPG